jgi:hypothetical protein
MLKSPSPLYQFFLAIAAALAILPGRRIHRLTKVSFLLARQQSGVIVHAVALAVAGIVETQGIAHRNVFSFQFFVFHKLCSSKDYSVSLLPSPCSNIVALFTACVLMVQRYKFFFDFASLFVDYLQVFSNC